MAARSLSAEEAPDPPSLRAVPADRSEDLRRMLDTLRDELAEDRRAADRRARADRAEVGRAIEHFAADTVEELRELRKDLRHAQRGAVWGVMAACAVAVVAIVALASVVGGALQVNVTRDGLQVGTEATR